MILPYVVLINGSFAACEKMAWILSYFFFFLYSEAVLKLESSSRVALDFR